VPSAASSGAGPSTLADRSLTSRSLRDSVGPALSIFVCCPEADRFEIALKASDDEDVDIAILDGAIRVSETASAP
jgi:hypothetical protein